MARSGKNLYKASAARHARVEALEPRVSSEWAGAQSHTTSDTSPRHQTFGSVSVGSHAGTATQPPLDGRLGSCPGHAHGPGAAYLELARAAAGGSAHPHAGSPRPLTLEVEGVLLLASVFIQHGGLSSVQPVAVAVRRTLYSKAVPTRFLETKRLKKAARLAPRRTPRNSLTMSLTHKFEVDHKLDHKTRSQATSCKAHDCFTLKDKVHDSRLRLQRSRRRAGDLRAHGRGRVRRLVHAVAPHGPE